MCSAGCLIASGHSVALFRLDFCDLSFSQSPLPHDAMLLAENAPSQVSAEDVLWAARSATFSLIPLGWLPFFDTHFPTKLHEVLECMAAGREGGSVAVTPSQEDISSTTGAERSAARVNRQLVLQELVSAIAVGVCLCVSIFVVVVFFVFFVTRARCRL